MRSSRSIGLASMSLMAAIASAGAAVTAAREINTFDRVSGLFASNTTPGFGKRGKRYAASVRQHQRQAAKARNRKRA